MCANCAGGGEKKKLTHQATATTKEGERRRAAASMGRPSLEALAMAGVKWEDAVRAGLVDDDDDDEEGAPPPAHLLAYEPFLKVVPPDMMLAFELKEAARAQRGEPPRSREEDMKEKLKLWAKAVARKAIEELTTYVPKFNVCDHMESLCEEGTAIDEQEKGNGLEQGKQGTRAGVIPTPGHNS